MKRFLRILYAFINFSIYFAIGVLFFIFYRWALSLTIISENKNKYLNDIIDFLINSTYSDVIELTLVILLAAYFTYDYISNTAPNDETKMKGFKQCNQGHYYDETLSECNYCKDVIEENNHYYDETLSESNYYPTNRLVQGFKQCKVGHFYNETLSECNYCNNNEPIDEKSKFKQCKVGHFYNETLSECNYCLDNWAKMT